MVLHVQDSEERANSMSQELSMTRLRKQEL